MPQNKPISHVVAGIAIAAILIIFSIIFSFASGASARPGAGAISYLFIIIGLVVFIYLYGKARDNYAPFGELFSYGFKATAAMTAVFVAFMIILAFAYPDLKAKSIEAARIEMEKQGKFSSGDIDKGMSMMEHYFWPFAIGATVLAYIIVGAIGSLIGAAITKKRPYNPIDQLDA